MASFTRTIGCNFMAIPPSYISTDIPSLIIIHYIIFSRNVHKMLAVVNCKSKLFQRTIKPTSSHYSNLGQNVPNWFPLHGSGSISPVAAYCSEQPGAVCQGCITPPLYGGLPLTDGPGCSIFWRCDGGISSRAAPFPNLGKGRGDRVEHHGGFTYEFYQQPL